MTNRPPTGTCEHDRTALAAFVLGGLTNSEANRSRQQLDDCDACRREAQEISQLRDLLTQVHSDTSGIPAHIHRRVRDRVVAAAVARRSRRRWTLIAAAASLVGAIGGAAVTSALIDRDPAIVTVAASSIEPFEVAGSVGFSRSESGDIIVALELDGLEPLPEPAVYEAWLYHTDGRIISIGQVHAVDGSIREQLAINGELHHFRGFWLTAEPDRDDPKHSGPTVVRATVPQW